MRRWGLVSVLSLASASPLWAQSADVVATAPELPADAPSQVTGYAALPGGLWAPSAEVLPAGVVSVALLGGYGMRNDLLRSDSSMSRTTGRLAIAYAPVSKLSIALSLDGRFDAHDNAPSDVRETDDGYVGDPHLLVRAGSAAGNVAFGGQLDLWVPGKDAPSVAGSAISVAASGLVSIAAGPALLSFNAGFRLDNSAKSVDDPTLLSVQDRVSLGVSEFHAVTGGAHLAIPLGSKAYVAAEGQVDVFVGSGATPVGATEAHSAPSPLVRFGASAGYHVNSAWTALAFVGGARVPKIDNAEIAMNDIRLVAYEPTVSFGLGLQARFGGSGKSSAIRRSDPKAIEELVFADVRGEIVDEAGKPAVGAKVVVKTSTYEGTGVTDDTGAYTVSKLPVGKRVQGTETITDTVGELAVEVSGKKPVTVTVKLAPGANTAERITLDPLLPPGQLRAVVRNASTGKPIAGATVKIEPGGQTATADANGQFSIDLPPGNYKITGTAGGFKDQELEVTIDPNGVAIKNIELRP